MNNIASYIEEVARHYKGEPNKQLSRGTELRFGNRGSFSVNLKSGTWFCHESNTGGGVIDLVRINEPASLNGGISEVLRDKFGIAPQQEKALTPTKYLAKQYDYYDSDGVLRYQVQRFEPKTFRQRRPDDKGGWLYNLQGVEALPYNLVGMLQQPDAPVFIVEGEKCAERLNQLGLVATTNHGGSKNWKPELNQYFKDRNVIVLPDNDTAGKAHADVVISQLYGTANAIKRVDLPGDDKDDVVDWLFKGGDVKQLHELVKATPPIAVEPEPAEPEDKPDVFETYSLDYLKNMPPVEWLVDGLLTAHGFAVLYGAPGIGKSFMSIDIALSVAYGMTWHDKVTKQGAVLYIAAEGVGGLGKRVKAWQAHYDTHGVTDFHVLPMAVKILEAPDLEKLLRTIDNFGVQFSMIVIDTVARTLASTGSDENDATAMGQFGEMCGVIQRHAGCAVLAVHHSGKDAARGMRGSSSLLGLSDTVLELTASEALLTLKVQKQKDAEPAQDATYELTPIQLIDDSSAILLPTEAAEKKRGAKLSERQLIALQALRNGLIDLQATQMSVNRWHDLHKDKAPDLTAAQRRDARAGLQDKGVIVIDGGKVWVNRDVGVNV
jgi:hypothetical protein